MRGIPVRIELGPKDIEAGVGRDRPQGYQREDHRKHR